MAQRLAYAGAKHKLGILEFRILHLLARSVASTAAQCSRHLNVMPSRVSLTIDKLEEAGYVRRRRDQPDRRLIILDVTAEGLATYQRVEESLSENGSVGKVSASADPVVAVQQSGQSA